ncbi:MAG: RNA polymerase-binding protein RbpA [Actinomycetales bacterium]
MSDKVLRGHGLGSASLESEVGVIAAARQVVEYVCPSGHVTSLPFSMEAEVPALWECRCGGEALRRDAERPEVAPGRPARTHWDMLMERRTVAELEELLAERLELLRAARGHQRSA